jgi:hypothetical protein
MMSGTSWMIPGATSSGLQNKGTRRGPSAIQRGGSEWQGARVGLAIYSRHAPDILRRLLAERLGRLLLGGHLA